MLRAVRQGELADRALARVLPGIPQRERAFAQELAYGVLRLRGRIDHRLSQVMTRPLSEVDADALDALRLGAYQLIDLNGIPPYAAVSESVELIKTRNARLSGFVNGVLKGLQRAQTFDFPSFDRDAVAHLRTWGSHPDWLVRRWIRQYGADTAADIVDANNERPDIVLQPLGMTNDAAIAALAAEHITAEAVTPANSGIRLVHGELWRALEIVPAVVQDPAARLVTRYIAARADDVLLDVCAAPGGKAVGIAQTARFTAASDVAYARLGRVLENFERVRAQDRPSPASLVVADARALPYRPCDIVFIDAPCTGTGTLRRHPDGRWRLRQADIASLVKLQAEILVSAAVHVRPGGYLVYATCSLEAEENEEQVEHFLSAVPGFAVAPPSDFPLRLDKRGFLHVMPNEFGFDGAFAARLRKVR